MTALTQQSELRTRLSRWVDEHGRAVRGYLLAHVRHLDVAEDLLQEVFRRAANAADRYQETGNARAYLFRIADRLVCDRGRKVGREVNVDPQHWQEIQPVTKIEPADTVTQQETSQQLQLALKQLTPPQRRVLLLRFYGELPFAQIAEIMNCPQNTVLSHCRRGLAKLRELLPEISR